MKGKSYTIIEIRDKLAAYCAYQDRCFQEVERKLDTFHLIPEARDEILLYLMKENFVNEERFAKSYARGKFYQKNWGRIKIILELKKRKITERLINTAMLEINDNDYYKTAEKLIESKFNGLNERDSYKRNQKVIRYMLQKGYEYELVREILNDKF